MVGIEAMNVYSGTACVDVSKLAQHRNLDMSRFENLMMKEKSVALPYEDPVTFGVNAAKPLIDSMTSEARERIEMLITCTESSFDFGKSMSTYFHDLLGLNRNCRLFELKNACYSGVAGLQMGINFILSNTSPGAKVLIIATDIARFMIEEGGDALSADWSFAEPSSGCGAVAMLVSDRPHLFQVDVGANGYYGYEVMDTCRPSTDSEAGDVDLSLLSYLDCCENAYREYQERVDGAHFGQTFGYLAYHTPFAGMVKGAHRKIMRKQLQAKPAEIEDDFQRRVIPGLVHCQRVGNIMGATAALSLASTIDHGDFDTPQRIGIFSYGSGCCSEFFSGVVTKEGQERLHTQKIKQQLDSRYALSMQQYDRLLEKSAEMKFGTRNLDADWDFMAQTRESLPAPTLLLKCIKEYHRDYEWVS
jgi:polyketide biosynthesis 3-hydroxy-3-methylglutaryl-CoA synthase-like enzyme PksG